MSRLWMAMPFPRLRFNITSRITVKQMADLIRLHSGDRGDEKFAR